jgi:hypothetical protein
MIRREKVNLANVGFAHARSSVDYVALLQFRDLLNARPAGGAVKKFRLPSW